MKKLFTLISILAILMLSGVFAADGVPSANTITDSLTSGYPPVYAGTRVNVLIELSNTIEGSNPISFLTVYSTNLSKDNLGLITIPKPLDVTITALAYGANKNATFIINIPPETIPGAYWGKFTTINYTNSLGTQSIDINKGYLIIVIPRPAGIVSMATPAASPTTVNPGASATVTAALSNTAVDSNPITLNVSSTDLTSGANTITKPIDVTVTNLANGANQNATFTISIPAGQAPGTYTGKLTATETANPLNKDEKTYSVIVNSTPSLSLSGLSSNPQGTQGSTSVSTFRVTNNGNTPLTGIVLSYANTTSLGTTDTTLTVQFDQNKFDLAPTAYKDITVTTKIPSGISMGTYSGNIIAKAADNTNTTMSFSIAVSPLSCVNGQQGSGYVEINSPSSSDNFEPGETINVNTIVHNRISSNKRFVVEAYLYNVDRNKKVSSLYRSSDRNIEGNSELSFRFSLKMDNNLNDGDVYRIYVKAYEKSKEENVCYQSSIPIDLNVPSDKVSIDSFSISPTTLSCGESSESLIQLSNLGQNDENVKVKLINNYLEIASEQTVTLKSERNENTANVRIPFKIAKNIKDGVYKVITEITYAGLPETKEQTITVKGCQPVAPVVTQSPPPQQNNQVGLPVVPLANQQNKDIFEVFNSAIETPTTFWLLADALLVMGIFALLVGLFRVRH